jgi:hypothetical protein
MRGSPARAGGCIAFETNPITRNLEVGESGCVLVLTQTSDTLELWSPYKEPRATQYGEVFTDEVFEFQDGPWTTCFRESHWISPMWTAEYIERPSGSLRELAPRSTC